MPKYFKAVEIGAVRRFAAWQEPTEAAGLTEDAVVYVDEAYRLTSSPFDDGTLLHDGADDAWREFCRRELRFAVPAWQEESEAVRRALAESGEL